MGYVISSPEFLAILSLYDTHGPVSVRRRPSVVVVRRPKCSKIFFSETAWPIEAKFYVEPPWVRGTKVCSLHPGNMTKMAATPIYGKNHLKILFSGTGGPISTKFGIWNRGLPGMTLD